MRVIPAPRDAVQNFFDPDGKLRVWHTLCHAVFGSDVLNSHIRVRRGLMLDKSQALLIDKGIELSNKLHSYFIDKRDDLTNPTVYWSHKLLFLGLLGYAASMAKFSELDKEDFMQLAEGFYDNVLIRDRD